MAVEWAAIITALAGVLKRVLEALGLGAAYKAGGDSVRSKQATAEAAARKAQQEAAAGSGDTDDPDDLAGRVRDKF